MEEVKMEIKDNVMTLEGEFDLELDISGAHFGFPSEDEDQFNKAAFEIKPYGEINIKYLPTLYEWLYRNSMTKSKTPSEWPKWKVTFERLE